MTAMSLPGLAPVVGVLVLTELAIGTVLATFLGDLSGEVGRGFLGTTALICLAIMGIDLGLLAILPDPSELLHHPVDASRFSALVHWSVAFTAVLAAYALFCAVGTDAARRVIGVAAVIVAGVTLARAAAAFDSPVLGGFAGAVTFVPAALLAGSTLAAMLLGHWYLIAPDLSFRPLRRGVYLIFATTAVQLAAITLGLAVAGVAVRHDLLAGQYGASFWLLVVGSGLVVTAGVNMLTLHYARTRANQPATAMLYILVISVLMGVVPGHLLYFLTQVPV
jgi:hypothetical protein